MERYIGIVFGKEGSAAAVVLGRKKNNFVLDTALAYNSGRFLSIDELNKRISIEDSECAVVGCFFENVVIVELEIPHDLMIEDIPGMIQFQMAWQVPIPESEMTYHFRRLERNPNIVRVVGIRRKQWQQQIDFLLSTNLQSDIITSPLIGGDVGLTEGNWRLSEFDSEFSFGESSIFSGDKADAKWSDSTEKLLTECVSKKEGSGSSDLIKVALQMALLAASRDALLLNSTSITIPEELKPIRHTLRNRITLLMTIIFIALFAGMMTRLVMTSMTNADTIEATKKVLDKQIEALRQENDSLSKACERGDEILKNLGNARLYVVLSNIHNRLPEGAYVENVRCGNDGAITMTLYGIGNVSKFREAISLIKGVIITAMPSSKNDKGISHTITIRTKEDVNEKQ